MTLETENMAAFQLNNFAKGLVCALILALAVSHASAASTRGLLQVLPLPGGATLDVSNAIPYYTGILTQPLTSALPGEFGAFGAPSLLNDAFTNGATTAISNAVGTG